LAQRGLIFFCTVSFFLFSAICYVYAAQEAPVSLDYPSFEGDFYASGKVFFPPSSVKSERNIIVGLTDTSSEIPSKITILSKWPNGSIQSANIIFAANSASKKKYVVIFGEDVLRKKSFTQPAVLPTVSFSTAGAPKTVEEIDLNVGQINVRVDKSPDLFYYWHIVPVMILIGIAYYRSQRLNKDR